jgi:formylglycine-generating enzyme required for sulfatase activity
MRLGLWLCLSVAITILTSAASAQERSPRVALVIGNASYPDANTPLATTIRDARAIADELRRADFAVDLKENVGKEDMERAINAFTARIRSGSVGLFYFGGFGIQSGRQTYLIPTNAQIWTEAEIRRDGISIDSMLADMHRKGAKVKIIIIDAARRNPFERRFRSSALGLAPLDAVDGTLAMYSAAPGKVVSDGSGGNSLFATELVKEIRSGNRTAEDAFNRTRIAVSRASGSEQVPWVSSSLVEEFYFGSPRAAASPSQGPGPRSGTSPAPSPAPRPAPGRASVEPPRTSSSPGDTFRDCADCAEVVVVPAGSFEMGSSSEYEGPVHRVSIGRPFAIGRFEVTFDEWDKCADDGGCKFRPDDREWGRGKHPVINVSWLDAQSFVAWLSRRTGITYRLPSEAEWEFAARAGTKTPYWWGREVGSAQANCRECRTGEGQKTSPVGSYRPNPFGLYDTAGNVAEWVEDCWNESYRGAPADGRAWTTGDCRLRVLRGGAFDSQARYLRSTSRFRYDHDVRFVANGFRVMRELP